MTLCDSAGVTTWGKLYLIDLAGSERISRSGVSDEGLKEAQHINTSLSALTTCILALHKKEAHIPYRNSKLTHILQVLRLDSGELQLSCCRCRIPWEALPKPCVLSIFLHLAKPKMPTKLNPLCVSRRVCGRYPVVR